MKIQKIFFLITLMLPILLFAEEQHAPHERFGSLLNLKAEDNVLHAEWLIPLFALEYLSEGLYSEADLENNVPEISSLREKLCPLLIHHLRFSCKEAPLEVILQSSSLESEYLKILLTCPLKTPLENFELKYDFLPSYDKSDQLCVALYSAGQKEALGTSYLQGNKKLLRWNQGLFTTENLSLTGEKAMINRLYGLTLLAVLFFLFPFTKRFLKRKVSP